MAILVRGRVRNASADTSQGTVGHYSDYIFGQVNMHLELSRQKGFLLVERLQDR